MLTLARLAQHHLAGGDASPVHESDPVGVLELVIQRTEGPKALGRRRNGAKGVVVVVRGQTEDSHDGVPDDLLDGAAVRLEDEAHLVEVAGQQLSQGLRVEPLAKAG